MATISTEVVTLTVRLSNGMKFDITLPENQTLQNTTILSIKELLSTISNEHIHNVPISSQRIIYKGRILDNGKTLADYSIVNQSTIFFVKSASGATPAAKTANSTATTTTTTSLPPTTRSTTTSATASLGSTGGTSPFAFPPTSINNTNMNSPFGAIDPSSFGAGGGLGGNNMDPATVMNNPMLRSMIQNNPEFLRNMMIQQMESNPSLQRMMEQNPTIRHMLHDPAQFQDMMNVISNPAAMQQMMRSQDLALSQIENMPGGFAALTNMYETIQRPLEEASNVNNSSTTTITSTTNSNNTGSSSSTTTNDGATGAAMPNPWGNPTTTATPPTRNINASSPTANPFTNMMMNNPNSNNDMMNIMNMMNNNANNQRTGGGGINQPSFEQRQAALNMLQNNPMMMNMMTQTLRSNPTLFRQMMMQQVAHDPVATAMFQNMPDEQFIQMFTSMMNPTTMNRILQMEQQMQGLNVHNNNSNTNAMNNPFLFNPWMVPNNNNNGLDFSSLLGNVGGGGMGGGSPWSNNNANVAINSTTPPGELYRIQLRSLYDMGFDDEIRNVAALQMTNGNVNNAVDMLLSGTIPNHAIQTAATALTSTGTSGTTSNTTTSLATSVSSSTETSNSNSNNDTADSSSTSTASSPDAGPSSTTTEDVTGPDSNNNDEHNK